MDDYESRVYNNYMRRFKIFITFVVIYEFIITITLHDFGWCSGVFNSNFCEYGAFKYFLMCVMVPIAFCIFCWWIPDIVRLFCNGACKTPPVPVKENIYDVLREIISPKDIERFITAAIIMGIQKFATNHPKTAQIFDDILNAIQKTPIKKGK